MLTVIIFIVILSLLVFVHEAGHFITAKKSGMSIEEFGFGFPPRIFGLKKGETTYSINWIPLGGFVKIKGENGELRNEPDSFSAQTFFKKAVVLSSGVLMNVVLAFVLLSVRFMIGLPSAVSDNVGHGRIVGQLKVQISGVMKDSPAEKAGLTIGDWIKKIDNQDIVTSQELQNYIKEHADQTVVLTYSRSANANETAILKPESLNSANGQKVLGVNLIQTGAIKYDFWRSWLNGAMATINLLWRIIYSFYDLIKSLILGHGLSADLSGPVGVAYMTGEAARLGFSHLLYFAALLSLNLAVINFVPFPALDGGRLLFIIIEKIRRRPNNQKIEEIIHGTGFALLMLLVFIITYRDILRYGGNFIDKIKNL